MDRSTPERGDLVTAPAVHFESPQATLWHGDCIETMRLLPDASIDAVVTDPPYGLEFMGKDWDSFKGDVGRGVKVAEQRAAEMTAAGAGHSTSAGPYLAARVDSIRSAGLPFQQWCTEWAAECLRVLKPGGHLLAFGGSRTWHRLAAGIEDAGFEIRDSIAWLYGSGFPKSLDVSKAIDRAAGATPIDTGVLSARHGGGVPGAGSSYEVTPEVPTLTTPATPEARAWQGWGTALKPAFEPIVVGRKPLAGTVAANVLAYSTGALNIDASRVRSDEALVRPSVRREDNAVLGKGLGAGVQEEPGGRWPTNVLLDPSQAAALDAQSGTLTSGKVLPHHADAGKSAGIYGAMPGGGGRESYGDSGGASRFFPTFRYEAKAGGAERPSVDGVQHPTVKPLALMEWLIRLVTPPGGTVLEPFAGSGTTLEAAVREGFTVIGIEREPDYLPLIVQRLTERDHQQSLFGDWEA